MTKTSNDKPSSGLTADDALFIRSLNKVQGLTSTQISNQLKIPRSTVGDILARRTWSNLPVGLLSWKGNDLPRHPDATQGCGLVYPDDSTKWCHRGAKHVGSHLWWDRWRTGAESVAWLALEMRALIDEVEPPAEVACPTPDGASSESSLATSP